MTLRTPKLLYDTTNENDLTDSGKLTFLYESRNKIYLYDSRNDNGFNDSSKEKLCYIRAGTKFFNITVGTFIY